MPSVPTSRPRSSTGLVRNGVVQEVERGRAQKIDVCDAHPELLRAARNVGRPTKEVCPICDDGRLVMVTFVFGAKLPAGGRCPGTVAELKASSAGAPSRCSASRSRSARRVPGTT